ncbi:MAG: NTP transferase domain-containing protein [Candidatus Binataceae bacterium]|nr:NTP transferase domain-containing protein [Candidatus Binataceae bacterium]
MVDRVSGAIIAAGRGERLRGASGGLPKPLVEIDGETLLARQVRYIAAAGARPIHAIVNHETARLIAARGLALPAEAQIIVRDTANSMESLLALGECIGPGRFLMTTVDTVVAPAEFQRFVTRATSLTDPQGEKPLDGALAVVQWRGDRHPLFAEIAADGIIGALGERESAMVTAGIYLFSTRIFAFADAARIAGLDAMRRYLGLLLDHGLKFAACTVDGVIDVDEAADLDAARALAAGRNAGS